VDALIDIVNVYVHTCGVVRVVSRDKYNVYVYDECGQPHHLPHCNVRWPGGSVQVALPTLAVLAGTDLPRDALALLRDSLDELCAAWDRLNPGREIK
jgi:hypothetical protein